MVGEGLTEEAAGEELRIDKGWRRSITRIRLYTADERPGAGPTQGGVGNRRDRLKHRLCKVSTVHQNGYSFFIQRWKATGRLKVAEAT